MRYVFDTSTIIIYLKDEAIKRIVEKKLKPFDEENIVVISAVTLGEIESIIIQNKWGEKRQEGLFELLEDIVVADINNDVMIEAYGKIDAFSQNRLPNKPLGTSARNMGKNDLWIAATANVTNATLISADKDFLHLKDEYIDLIFIDIQTKTIS